MREHLPCDNLPSSIDLPAVFQGEYAKEEKEK